MSLKIQILGRAMQARQLMVMRPRQAAWAAVPAAGAVHPLQAHPPKACRHTQRWRHHQRHQPCQYRCLCDARTACRSACRWSHPSRRVVRRTAAGLPPLPRSASAHQTRRRQLRIIHRLLRSSIRGITAGLGSHPHGTNMHGVVWAAPHTGQPLALLLDDQPLAAAHTRVMPALVATSGKLWQSAAVLA